MSGSSEAGCVRRHGRRVALAASLAALGLALAAPAAPAAPLSRCAASGRDRTLCGRVTVPLDRGGRLPGTIGLRVRALPPAHGAPVGTVLALAGGPGQAAVPLLEDFASALGPALGARTLVTFDQRGTGGSGRIACSSLVDADSLASAVGACARELGPGRVAYTTAESAADVEAVRAALGVDRLLLYGTSYGTKVALAYAAAHPERVERMVLDSVVLPGGVDPWERTTLASIPRVLRALCAHDCRFTRNPAADLAALVRRLGHRRLHGAVLDGAGRRRSASLTRTGLLELLLAGDFDRYLRAALPAAVRAALDGDPAPLLRLTRAGGEGPADARQDSDAVYLATTCEDGGVPWAPGTPLERRRSAVELAGAALPERTFAPFDRATVRALGTADLCRGWPEAPIAQPSLPPPTTPALILSGDDDLRTPRADAVALALRLPGAQFVQVPDTGHGVLFGDPTYCSARAVAAFLAGGVARACRPHGRAAPALGIPPRRLADLAPVRGVPRRAARTVRAIAVTLADATTQVLEQITSGGGVHAFGGLRAGSAALGAGGVRLRGYAYVPGVGLSGSIPARGRRFTLRLGGSAAARGRVTIAPEGIAGVIGGVRVRAGAAALGWGAAASIAAQRGQCWIPRSLASRSAFVSWACRSSSFGSRPARTSAGAGSSSAVASIAALKRSYSP